MLYFRRGGKTKVLTNCLERSKCLVLWSLENGSKIDRNLEDEDMLSFAWSSQLEGFSIFLIVIGIALRLDGQTAYDASYISVVAWDAFNRKLKAEINLGVAFSILCVL